MKMKIYSVLTGFLLLAAGCGSGNSSTNNLVAVNKPTYQRDNILFSLSYLSNINYGRWGTPAVLQQAAVTAMNAVLRNDTVTGLIGNWTPVWGPVTFTADSTTNPDTCVSDNTMVLLKGNDPSNPDTTLYVLAIAGTVTGSAYDWAGENLVLDTMAQWPALVKGQSNVGQFGSLSYATDSSVTNKGNYISKGLGNGLNILFNKMSDGTAGSLMNYLKDSVGNSSTPFELVVAGHSLGGALSPCVALSLIDNQAYWNPSANCSVGCFATAGYSPGNQNFATYCLSKLGAGFGGACNSKDVAVHVYQASLLPEIAGLYDTVNGNVYPSLQNECFIGGFINCISSPIAAFGYTGLYNMDSAFTSTVDINAAQLSQLYQTEYAAYSSLPDSIQIALYFDILNFNCPTPLNDTAIYARTLCFGAMTLQQHVQAYINYFSISQFYNIYSEQLYSGALPSSLSSTMVSAMLANPLTGPCLNPEYQSAANAETLKKWKAAKAKAAAKP